MSAKKTPLVDPKELLPAALGVVIGVGILVFFVLLATALGMPLLVNYGNVPGQ